MCWGSGLLCGLVVTTADQGEYADNGETENLQTAMHNDSFLLTGGCGHGLGGCGMEATDEYQQKWRPDKAGDDADR